MDNQVSVKFLDEIHTNKWKMGSMAEMLALGDR